MKYVYFPGCVTPQKENAYELSMRKVAEKFGIQLLDLEGANCCGFFMEPIDHLSATLLAARNLSLAEEKKCDLLTLCPACFGHLTKVKKELTEDQELRKTVNEALAEINKKFEGFLEVKHFIKVLLVDVGITKIKRTITKPLTRLKVVPHYGCHILKPSDELKLDNPENPTLLDSLIKATGVTFLDYMEKRLCCGAPIIGVNEKLSLRIMREKLRSVQKVKADAIITVCPFCHLHFDLNQFTVQEEYSEEYNIPILHYTQLLGLAQGLSPEELGLYENRVPTDIILEIL